ncbi:oligoribonuclease [Cryobacterium zhongshanensis]|uniref:Oligoribonuclease n=1 Tax=Cryobacterium zhongshanensis TaxID=2928153 RepID=A0AA41QXM7_9MICO|nr:oligoribonuclease [Cryobacterium zhongshanensis]MCI4659546.1 oligoribonuclease [Cryobacterium zhongshanensis]
MLTPVPVDLETTGRDVSTHVILEFAMLLVTPELEFVADFGSRVLHASEEQLAQMNDFVTNMHTGTGLVDLVRASTLTVEQLDLEVTQWLASHGHHAHDDPRDRTAIILGSSCRLDLNFIEAQMPLLTTVLHYRMLDISGTREALLMWQPEMVAPGPFVIQPDEHGVMPIAHRAASDIRWSLEEARGLRASVAHSALIPF